ncbi:hypothetical protein ACRRTK_000211 [Alexandromys fortis]
MLIRCMTERKLRDRQDGARNRYPKDHPHSVFKSRGISERSVVWIYKAMPWNLNTEWPSVIGNNTDEQEDIRWNSRGIRQDEGILEVKSTAAGAGSTVEPVTEPDAQDGGDRGAAVVSSSGVGS